MVKFGFEGGLVIKVYSIKVVDTVDPGLVSAACPDFIVDRITVWDGR